MLAAAYFGLSTVAYAARGTECLLNALHVLTEPQVDSSVELELDTTSKVLNLLTTTDGKVSGLLEKGDRLPAWFQKWEQQKYPAVQDGRDLDWDLLDDDTKMHLLRDVSKGRKQRFFSDRKIHGVVVRSQVKLEFDKPTVLLGKHYDPGEHIVDISSVMGGKVEYRAPTEVNSVSGVELHFRGNQSSGRISNDAWTMLDGLGINRNHQHVHIVAPLPVEELRSEPRVQAALMGDFFRRSNLAAEMVSIIHDNDGILTNQTSTAVYFDSLTPKRLEGATRYFTDVASGQSPKIGDQFKMGWVGMRGSDKYDGPLPLWGVEVRSIGSKSDPDLCRNLLDGLQSSMNTRQYGLSKEQMSSWLNRHASGDVPQAIKGAWYNQPWVDLFRSAPTEIRSRLSGLIGWIRKLKIKAGAERNRELKMLVYDWSNDPLLWDRPTLLQKIKSEQVRAIDRVLKGNGTVNEIMSDFLIDSGLYDETLKSVGVELKH